MPLLLTDDDVSQCLTMAECLAAMRIAYRSWRRQGAQPAAHRRPSADVGARPLYRFKTFEGAVPGLGTLAHRIDSDVVGWPVVDGKRRQVKYPVTATGTSASCFSSRSTRAGRLR